VRVRGGKIVRSGVHFPVTRFDWRESRTYRGCEIDHLWFSRVIGERSFGNLVVTWRGAMDVQLENVRDQTERIQWDTGTRIRGPDLYHVVCEFPQIGNDIRLMYAFQAMLCDELAIRLVDIGHTPEIRGTDVYVGGGKLNVGVCSATASSCTMHFGVNIGLEGDPGIPDGVDARGLAELLGEDGSRAAELMDGVVTAWLERLDGIHLKAYKTR